MAGPVIDINTIYAYVWIILRAIQLSILCKEENLLRWYFVSWKIITGLCLTTTEQIQAMQSWSLTSF